MVCRKGKVKNLLAGTASLSEAGNIGKSLMTAVNNDFSPVDKQDLFK